MVFFSLWEGFGFFVLEVMGCGIFVIIFNILFLLEVVGDVVILVNFKNVGEIIDVMNVIV